MSATLTFQATQGIARLTPVHLELASAALLRAGASGLKPRWLTPNVNAELRYSGIDGSKAIDAAAAALKGSGLVIGNRPEA
jgi:hypothetical protein